MNAPNTYTVGPSGAAWHFIDIQCLEGTGYVIPVPMVSITTTGCSGASLHGAGLSNIASAPTLQKYRGALQRLVYLAAGNFFKVRILSSNTSLGLQLTTDGPSYVQVMKLN